MFCDVTTVVTHHSALIYYITSDPRQVWSLNVYFIWKRHNKPLYYIFPPFYDMRTLVLRNIILNLLAVKIRYWHWIIWFSYAETRPHRQGENKTAQKRFDLQLAVASSASCAHRVLYMLALSLISQY